MSELKINDPIKINFAKMREQLLREPRQPISKALRDYCKRFKTVEYEITVENGVATEVRKIKPARTGQLK